MLEVVKRKQDLVGKDLLAGAAVFFWRRRRGFCG